MRSFQSALHTVLCCCFLASCSSVNVGRPGWIDNPEGGVSAAAGMHIRGKVAQEELAVFRAREEYAKRFGVKIAAAQTMATSVSNSQTSTVSTQIALEELNQNNVKAEVKAKWRDPSSDELWIWLVPSAH